MPARRVGDPGHAVNDFDGYTGGLLEREIVVPAMLCLMVCLLGQASDPASVLKPVDGITVKTWASTPLVLDPVSFCIDDQGRVYVAESFRQEHGVEDNRSQPYWLLDDLAATRPSDRLAKYEKWAHKRANGMDWYTEKEDRITRLEDTDGDGVADTHTIVADGFNGPLDGTGAGLICIGNEVWYTCIPHLWRVVDADDDGVAEARSPIFSGFGVRDALRGHDLHGLIRGPDDRIYWSMGDRGYHVTTPDGTLLADPRSGAVFRCEPDGSKLERFCTGLRNPQELAFDRFGYLFTGDNNSDGGDRARMVYCAEGGQSGWEMNYQTMAGDNLRGPWMQEGIWKTDHEDRPAWVLPPLAHVGSGPSGLVAYPGQGLSDRYEDHLFMCNFLGGSTPSGVIAMEMVPDGAGFKVEDVHDFVTGVLCTDVDFDLDGSMLVSDWVDGWLSTQTGRIFRLSDPTRAAVSQATKALLKAGFSHRDDAVLLDLMEHVDQRVRQRAQFELADRGRSSIASLIDLAADAQADRMARIHAIWALGIIARRQGATEALEGVLSVVWDDDAEVRGQAVRVLADAAYAPAWEDLLGLAFDVESRVVYHALMGLGRIGDPDAFDAIVEVLWSNDNQDRWLRHAAVLALARIGDHERLLQLLGDPQDAVRLGAVLALRRLGDPAVARVLRDANSMIAAEAARAIYDGPIVEAQPALADMVGTLARAPSEAGMTYDVRWDVFEDIDPVSPDELLTHEAFERVPDETSIRPMFIMPGAQRNRYLSRMTGRILPTQSGSHRFAIVSDDSSILSIWPEAFPERRRVIARVDGWVPIDGWSASPGQTSPPIEMVAGQAWILEARHSEGGGGDHLAIGWKQPDQPWARPIGQVMPSVGYKSIARRAMSAALLDGSAHRIPAVAAVALDPTQGDVLRREAMEVLRQWPDPEPLDRVQGRWRPMTSPRDLDGWRAAMNRLLPALAESDDVVAIPAREIAATFGIPLDPAMLMATLRDSGAPMEARISTLHLLARQDKVRREAIELAWSDPSVELRAVGLVLMAKHRPEEAMVAITRVIESEHEQLQRAAIQSLAILDAPDAASLLHQWSDNIEQASPALALDVIEAARHRSQRGDTTFDPIVERWYQAGNGEIPAAYGLAASGGDADRGRDLVFYHAGASCLRCHVIGDTGGPAGPSLSGVGTRLTADQLLRSLVQPQAELAEGFEATTSAMPAMTTALSSREIRDVVAYLQMLQATSD